MDNSLDGFQLVRITEEAAKKCTNHHIGCDCREFAITELLKECIKNSFKAGFRAGLSAQKDAPNQE